MVLAVLLMPFFKNDASLEKRQLAKLPAYLENGHLNLNFSDQFESFVNDNLPLRASLLTASNQLKGELLHAQTSNVIVGEQGWLFYNYETGVTTTVTPVLSFGFCGAKSDARYECGQGCIPTSSDLASLSHLPLKGTAFSALAASPQTGIYRDTHSSKYL